MSEGWHGGPFDRPLALTREYSDIVRTALRREKVRYDGEHYTQPLPDGVGKALPLAVHPVRDLFPMHLAAIGPKSLELVGELFDGWLAIFFSPEWAEGQLASIEATGRRSTRRCPGFDVVPTVLTVVCDARGPAPRPGALVHRAERRRYGQYGRCRAVRVPRPDLAARAQGADRRADAEAGPQRRHDP